MERSINDSGWARSTKQPTGLWWTGAIVFQFFSAMYGGYFGAGNGILMLAAMGLLGINELHRANGIKNFLGICINSIAVLSFALAASSCGRTRWSWHVARLLGGYFGASMAVRVGPGLGTSRRRRDRIRDFRGDGLEIA